MVKVVSHVPRNASGGKTQEGNHKGRGGAGKLLVFRRAKWRSGEEGVDPWEGGKAGRWLGEKGGWMVRAGLRAWGLGKLGGWWRPGPGGVVVWWWVEVGRSGSRG
jgi:hypothetical protein